MPTHGKMARSTSSKVVSCSLEDQVELSFVKDFEQRTKRAVESGGSVNSVLSADDVKALLQQTAALCTEEPALIEIRPGQDPAERVTVVGDTHGHFLELVNMWVTAWHVQLQSQGLEVPPICNTFQASSCSYIM
jgi:hypothetical protein